MQDAEEAIFFLVMWQGRYYPKKVILTFLLAQKSKQKKVPAIKLPIAGSSPD